MRTLWIVVSFNHMNKHGFNFEYKLVIEQSWVFCRELHYCSNLGLVRFLNAFKYDHEVWINLTKNSKNSNIVKYYYNLK